MTKIFKMLSLITLVMFTTFSCNETGTSREDTIQDWAVISSFESQTKFTLRSDNHGELSVVDTNVGITMEDVGKRVIVFYTVVNEASDIFSKTQISVEVMGTIPVYPTDNTIDLEGKSEAEINEFWAEKGDDEIEPISIFISGGYFNIQFSAYSTFASAPHQDDRLSLVYMSEESTDDIKKFKLKYLRNGDADYVVESFNSFIGVDEFFEYVDKDYNVELEYYSINQMEHRTFKFNYNPVKASL